ncbi:hypothetical protein GY45DRAFT_1332687, partial [Cubamyces sp. BRFM 1775]
MDSKRAGHNRPRKELLYTYKKGESVRERSHLSGGAPPSSSSSGPRYASVERTRLQSALSP